MEELSTYAVTLNTVRGMTRPDYIEHLAKLTSSGFGLERADTNPESSYAIVTEKTTE